MRKSLLAGIALLIVACAHAGAGKIHPIDYMGALRDAEAKVAQFDQEPKDTHPSDARSAALQQLAVARSMVGDYEGALDAGDEAFGRKESQNPGQHAKGVEDAREILARYETEDALQAIVREARDRQVVILNEAHHVARHRAFALQVARELRKLGFQYFAVEALAPPADELWRRGYAVERTGHYVREPYFGDLLRQSLKLGYLPVVYEQAPEAAPAEPADMIARIDAREEAQAQNLVDRVFKNIPHAWVFIYVGYQHATKGLTEFPDGRKVAWMAERLKQKTGIDPLCIDQANATQQSPFMVEGLASLLFGTERAQEVVLRSQAGVYWPANDSVNMQVVHRQDGYVGGRPIWTALITGRHAVDVPGKLLPRSGRRLIQAFVEDEAVDAVPMNQVLVHAGDKHPVIMLPDGKYRYTFQD